jgi:putative pantetheine hydrolase
MPAGSLQDVAGITVGHAHRLGDGWLTGTTVVLAQPGGVVAAVDVRGAGPATHETGALDPTGLVPRIDAVMLTGGSAYGLDAVSGVRRWLEAQHRGFSVGPEPHQVVPIVPGAALFDLGRGGDFTARPDAAMGYAAAVAAARAADPVATGCVGAGTGAVAGGLKGGIGTASTTLPDGVVVAALIAVNTSGSTLDVTSGALLGAAYGAAGEFPEPPSAEEHAAASARMPEWPPGTGRNTAIGVVATTADLTRTEAKRLAMGAHDGLARAVRPSHTMFDGDALFALATGARALPEMRADEGFSAQRAQALTAVLAAGADVVARAVAHGMLAAHGVGGILSYRDLYPSAAAHVHPSES